MGPVPASTDLFRARGRTALAPSDFPEWNDLAGLAFGAASGSDAMPTATELRSQAKECLQLANRTNEFHVKTALTELARKLNREAHQAERRQRDTASFSNNQMSLR